MAVNGVVGAIVLHRAFEVGGHHPHGDRRAVCVPHPSNVHRPRRMQRCKHAVLLDPSGRAKRVLRHKFLLDDALLDEILVSRVTERNYSSRETMRVILGLQLHLLLLVHLDGVQAVLVYVWRLVGQLLRQLLLLHDLLLVLLRVLLRRCLLLLRILLVLFDRRELFNKAQGD